MGKLALFTNPEGRMMGLWKAKMNEVAGRLAYMDINAVSSTMAREVRQFSVSINRSATEA